MFKYADIEIEEGIKYDINDNLYFVIYDYDIRFFDDKKLLLGINTYPHNPRIILKYINHFN